MGKKKQTGTPLLSLCPYSPRSHSWAAEGLPTPPFTGCQGPTTPLGAEVPWELRARHFSPPLLPRRGGDAQRSCAALFLSGSPPSPSPLWSLPLCPGLQLYSGSFLGPQEGRAGQSRDKRCGWVRRPKFLKARACTRSGRGLAGGTAGRGGAGSGRGRAEGGGDDAAGPGALDSPAGTGQRTAAAQ